MTHVALYSGVRPNSNRNRGLRARVTEPSCTASLVFAFLPLPICPSVCPRLVIEQGSESSSLGTTRA